MTTDENNNVNHDVIDQMQQEARRLRVSRILPKGKLSHQLIVAVRNDFQAFVIEHDLSLSQVSRKMGQGFSISSLSNFHNYTSLVKFAGDATKIARGINQWMETYFADLQAPRPKDFVETEVAKKMLTVIRNSIELRAIGTIYCDAGRGKTITLQAANTIYIQSIYIRVMRTTRTVTGLAKQLAEALRLGRTYTTYDAQKSIIEKLKGTGRPLLIDEAHQLNNDAFEFLRDLHDVCEIPIILAGTHNLQKKMDDKSEYFGQFSSRTALRYDVTEHVRNGGSRNVKPLHTIADIKAIWQSDTLRLSDDAVMLLYKIANTTGIGALRLCKQLVLVAHRAAGGKQIDSHMIMRVMTKLHGSEVANHVRGEIDKSNVRVA